ncbi:DUF3153 domain-containing protein [Mycobacterium sp. NPDC050853]|uniref:LppM family (lipo)protein n=1 Tax=Mycobacteriaceae TaxID=1762 RepID=UPI0015DD76D7|nr:DUF3153 domain-containing protein [Mycobacteroides sp. LB1]
MARITAVLLLTALPLLSGCVRVKASMTVTTDDHVSGQLIAVAKPQGKNDKGPQLDRNLSFAQKVQVSDYEENGMVGSRAIFNDLTFAEVPQLAGMNKNAAGFDLTLRRNGDVVVLEGRADLTALEDTSNADVSLAVSFPGDIESTNGETLGSDSVQWKLTPGVVSNFTATARYTDPSTRSFNGAAIFVTVAALLVGALVASMAWLARDQSPRFTPDQIPE